MSKYFAPYFPHRLNPNLQAQTQKIVFKAAKLTTGKDFDLEKK
jgi:hypothetical protein